MAPQSPRCTIELPAFSSRLDDSAPSFGRWAAYVEYRLGQIRARGLANDALDIDTLDQASAAITDLAPAVSDAARPTACHRDLHADNLLVAGDGRLLAILDWDMTEAWDPAGEWFKLDFMLFPALPGGEASFDAAYFAVHTKPERWRERKRLVDLMETLNAIANADPVATTDDFGSRLRSRLRSLVG